MKTAGDDFKASIDKETSTLCRLLVITRADGTIYRFTDTDQPVKIGADTYRSDISFTSSAIMSSSAMLAAQSVNLSIALNDDAVTEIDIRNKKYRKARATIYLCDYENPTYGTVLLFDGTFGRIELGDTGRVDVDILPISTSAGRSLKTESYSPTCRAALGDARCTVDIEALAVDFTVTAVDGSTFTADELDQDNDNWKLGVVKWVTGGNANSVQDVLASVKDDKSVTLVVTPIVPVAVGDTGRIYPGCDKQPSTCLNRFDNIANMRAEPFVPQASIYKPPTVSGYLSGG